LDGVAQWRARDVQQAGVGVVSIPWHSYKLNLARQRRLLPMEVAPFFLGGFLKRPIAALCVSLVTAAYNPYASFLGIRMSCSRTF